MTAPNPATWRVGASLPGDIAIIRFACNEHLHFKKLDPSVKVFIRPYDDGPRTCDFCNR